MAFALRPLAEWHFDALPDLLTALLRTAGQHWLVFLPIAAVTIYGWWVVARLFIARLAVIRFGRGSERAGLATSLAPADRLAALFALMETGHLAFLFICYLGAFAEDETRRAAEFLRYQAELGAAGLTAAASLSFCMMPVRKWRS